MSVSASEPLSPGQCPEIEPGSEGKAGFVSRCCRAAGHPGEHRQTSVGCFIWGASAPGDEIVDAPHKPNCRASNEMLRLGRTETARGYFECWECRRRFSTEGAQLGSVAVIPAHEPLPIPSRSPTLDRNVRAILGDSKEMQ